ncbi:MAG: TGS domain-containing protein, partial [Deltaproteobacteria bacterium]|nr:TGS domain-containing protein [Deltaproteobacteria bacterium]
VLPVSAITGRNLELLKQTIFQQLEIIRVYSKAPGKEPDLSQPFVLKKGHTVHDFAGKVHKDFVQKLKVARVWGESVYDGQMVQRDHALHDGDVVELQI